MAGNPRATITAAMRQQGHMQQPQSTGITQSPWWNAASAAASFIPGVGPFIGAGMAGLGAYGAYQAYKNPGAAFGQEGHSQQLPLYTPEQQQYMHGILSNLQQGNWQNRALEGLAQGPTPVEQQYANMYQGLAPQFAQQFMSPQNALYNPQPAGGLNHVLNNMLQRYGPSVMGDVMPQPQMNMPSLYKGKPGKSSLKVPNSKHKHTQSCKRGGCSKRRK